MRGTVQKWIVTQKGRGYGFYLMDAADGQDRAIESPELEGAPYGLLLDYFGTFAYIGDLLLAPDRVYQFQPPIRGV